MRSTVFATQQDAGKSGAIRAVTMEPCGEKNFTMSAIMMCLYHCNIERRESDM